MRSLPEHDWETLQAIQNELFDIACHRIVDSVRPTLESGMGYNHEEYWDLLDILSKEDQKISDLFHDWNRSNAMDRMAALVEHDLIPEERLRAFSEETHASIARLNSL